MIQALRETSKPELGFIEGDRQTPGQESRSDAPQSQESRGSLDIVEGRDRALTVSSDDVCRHSVCVHFNERRKRSQPDSTDSDLDRGNDRCS